MRETYQQRFARWQGMLREQFRSLQEKHMAVEATLPRDLPQTTEIINRHVLEEWALMRFIVWDEEQAPGQEQQSSPQEIPVLLPGQGTG